ncbi:nitrous oxide reductase family maturation protein NosD [Marinobacter sp. M216]|uniref:Nitrous oxide reductase family maturation protein NosD n=1 Tax=Marinobacter albus TaxID=3030833 RepID=A0ABT7H8T1_9GAMM|nr:MULTISPECIES: nitrous oxide reductase family maturation protein NosD [unclassified Marinobacter]MBW7470969.1 nitrous oxide reductase family maturation protein NosD [Marinobacter sp. F4218]MDK9556751.1 nitrous oxide reductase family maturation protein NosD [Marinobacter sp. M216]
MYRLLRYGVALAIALLSLTASADLQQRLDALAPGATFELPPEHLSPLTIKVPGVTVTCAPETVIDGERQGNAVEIQAEGVTFRGCLVRNWGDNLNELDAGIFVAREARGAVVQGNRLQGPAFGVWLDATPDVTVRNNTIRGDASMRPNDRGNGIHLFNTTGALVEDNDIRQTRDAIYIETANHNAIRNNVMADLRYGIHYMYSMDNLIEGNVTRGTRTGYALMQSKRLRVLNNRSENDENYGILMNFITQSELRGNVVTGVSQGQTAGVAIGGAEGKAVFIYNSLYNTFAGNVFADSNIGIHLTAGSEDNQVFGNAFVNNQQQVKYVATRTQEWSREGEGNYWSDYLGWDRNQDGVGDVPYEPNDNVDRLLWKYPEARILMFSPAVDTLRWVQDAFPVVKSAGVSDSHPLMRIPTDLRPES